MSRTYRMYLQIWSPALANLFNAEVLDSLAADLWSFDDAEPQPDGSIAYSGVDQLTVGFSEADFANEAAGQIKEILGPDTRVQVIATRLEDAAGVTFDL